MKFSKPIVGGRSKAQKCELNTKVIALFIALITGFGFCLRQECLEPRVLIDPIRPEVGLRLLSDTQGRRVKRLGTHG